MSRTLVVGLARSGVAAARLLLAEGADVVAVDRGTPDVDLPGADVRLGTDGLEVLDGVGLVVKSPGVPREAPVVAAAAERGIEVIGELELAWRRLHAAGHRFVAVTGTNGKTTTVELLGHVYRTAGLPVAVAGNVGTAVASLVGTLDPRATVVCEASSFQLEDSVGFAPEVAVLLNVEPDHLDRHGTFAAYRDAKLRIFANQGNDDVAVAPSDLGVEDLGGCARRVCVGERPDDDVSLRAGTLFWDAEPLLRADEIRIRGAHNVRNAMAAAAAALASGIEAGAVREALRSFPGVAHRLEEVAVRDGVTYVNDSKATNVGATLTALAAFAGERVHLILGGQGKAQDFAPLREAVAACASVHLIGEDAAAIAAAAGRGEHDGTLERAVAAARAAAVPGDIVLLSPACASFDQFADFEARGDAFRALVT